MGVLVMVEDAIFLSASIPDPRRNPRYAKTSDPIAIGAAVAGLLYVTLGRRLLVWGGHPAITPMVWAAAEDIGVEYGSWVQLYQSCFFQEDFPRENAQFQNVTYVDAVPNDRDASLAAMRRRMVGDHQLLSAVFIGGMEGVEAEFELVRELHPTAPTFAIDTTGGAALVLRNRYPDQLPDLSSSIDYIGMFHRLLDVPTTEGRIKRRIDRS